jgi:RNA polymerase sigma factor (sigma-70 family)
MNVTHLGPDDRTARRQALWNEVFQEIERLLFTIAARIHQDVFCAEDDVQNTWIAIYGACASAPELDTPEQMRKYACKTVANFALGRVRRVTRETQFPEEFGDGTDLVSTTVAKLDVGKLLRNLSEVDRRIVELLIFEGCRLADVAEVTGMTAGYVSLRKMRLLRKLRAKLAGGEDPRDNAPGQRAV